MSLVALLIWLIVLLCIVGIVWYVMKSIPLPEPVRIVIMCVIALICILVLLQIAGVFTGGPILIR